MELVSLSLLGVPLSGRAKADAHQGETEAVRSRPRRGRGSFSEAEANQWNTKPAGMRPRHQIFCFEAAARRGICLENYITGTMSLCCTICEISSLLQWLPFTWLPVIFKNHSSSIRQLKLWATNTFRFVTFTRYEISKRFKHRNDLQGHARSLVLMPYDFLLVFCCG